ncbi:MAG: hypothetical protein ABI162_08350 [Luteolibacter sp.]
MAHGPATCAARVPFSHGRAAHAHAAASSLRTTAARPARESAREKTPLAASFRQGMTAVPGKKNLRSISAAEIAFNPEMGGESWIEDDM